MRLPVDVLEQHMSQILEGLLLWSEDSKNKFRLKVQRPHMHALHLALCLAVPQALRRWYTCACGSCLLM